MSFQTSTGPRSSSREFNADHFKRGQLSVGVFNCIFEVVWCIFEVFLKVLF